MLILSRLLGTPFTGLGATQGRRRGCSDQRKAVVLQRPSKSRGCQRFVPCGHGWDRWGATGPIGPPWCTLVGQGSMAGH